MDFNLNTKEERIEYLNFCFNVVGSGFGREINEKIKNMSCVKDFIDGEIDKDVFLERVRVEKLYG